MFPYGLGWPGNYSNPQQPEVDWANLARQWIQHKDDTPESNDNPSNSMYDPSIPPPTYIPHIMPPNILPPIPPPNLQDISIENHIGLPILPVPPPPMQSTQLYNPPSFLMDTIPMTSDSQCRQSVALLPTPAGIPHYINQWAASPKQQVPEQEILTDYLKKKRLPAWIREGLEKIEQEKNKKIIENINHNYQKSEDEESSRVELDLLNESQESDDSKGSRSDNKSLEEWSERVLEANTYCIPSDLSPEEIMELKMTVLRRIMTGLLLSVTNTEMRELIEFEKTRMHRMKDDKPKRLALSAALSNLANEDSSSDSFGDHSSHSSPVLDKVLLKKQQRISPVKSQDREQTSHIEEENTDRQHSITKKESGRDSQKRQTNIRSTKHKLKKSKNRTSSSCDSSRSNSKHRYKKTKQSSSSPSRSSKARPSKRDHSQTRQKMRRSKDRKVSRSNNLSYS